MADLSLTIGGRHGRSLRLRNPVMVASGTFGYGSEYDGVVDIQRLGAIVCKGTTLRARQGNPAPRLAETSAGLLNSIGLQNVGIRALIREKAPMWARWQVPVLVNIAGESVDEYRRMAAMLEGVPGIGGIEINVSCPNVAEGGIEFGRSPRAIAEVTEAVRRDTSLPLLVKLTPNVTDITEGARAAVDAGADALTVANTLVGLAIDVEGRRPILGNVSGGLSGPAIKPVALHLVYRVSSVVDVPVVGCGGISTAGDALEFLLAGASAIQVGTATFANPRASLEVLDGIEAYADGAGWQRLQDMVGAARPPKADDFAQDSVEYGG